MSQNGKELISNILKEAESYSSLDIIESYIEQGQDLSNLPVQPLYVAIKSLPPAKVAMALEKFSAEQRETFLDLDLWTKDDIDPQSFHFWLSVYSATDNDEMKYEFINSNEFTLYLKGKMSFWTFDLEDPEYPDHDNYFLTECNQLLFEFDEDFEYVGEIKQFVKDFYSQKGVDHAYQHLFKIVSDGFLNMQEEEYRFKKHRLNDLGFVDYYDALELNNPFPSNSHVDLFINKKEVLTPEIDAESLNQCLDKNALIAFKSGFESINDELAKVESKVRLEFLQFNFTKLVNSTLTLQDALKDGAMAMTRIGKVTLNTLKLGLSYIQNFTKENGLTALSDTGIFNLFDFVEIYRIGHSLILLEQKRLKKALAQNEFTSENDSFLGEVLYHILEESFASPVQVILNKVENEKVYVSTFENYQKWKNDINLFSEILPFVRGFYKTFNELKAAGQVMDDYYLNFGSADIDFEALLLSTFINHANGEMTKNGSPKIGVTVAELRTFSKDILCNELSLDKKVKTFISEFGLNEVTGTESYIQEVLKFHLSGYDLEELETEEFRHVGGPLILNKV
ncbi:hypothetical protein A9Q84_12535 [Halobacteriovorax marinus]|uniref:Uncharacterized protein n=1 Tax=Halobacteriovorax marinus TaxID=97084 RepID=A0A1Y5F878_9BACT|nr:hypothetical protein A9Q84_12535 [Halobacteriovorax marinus]